MFNLLLFPIEKHIKGNAAIDEVINFARAYQALSMIGSHLELEMTEKNPSNSLALQLPKIQNKITGAGKKLKAFQVGRNPVLLICNKANKQYVDLITMEIDVINLAKETIYLTNRVITLSAYPLMVVP